MTVGHFLAIAPFVLFGLSCLYGLSFDVRHWWQHRHEPERLYDDEAKAVLILFPEAGRRVRQAPKTAAAPLPTAGRSKPPGDA